MTAERTYHPGSVWNGCSQYGACKCEKCLKGEKYFSCCGNSIESSGCAILRGEKDVCKINGRWNTSKGLISISQVGRTATVLSPKDEWCNTKGVIIDSNFKVLNCIGNISSSCKTITFPDPLSTTWTWVSNLNEKEERLRSILCNFYYTFDKRKLRDADDMVEQYLGRKVELRDALVEIYHRIPGATEHIDNLLGTANKWWYCELCHGVLNAMSFSICVVCGCDRPIDPRLSLLSDRQHSRKRQKELIKQASVMRDSTKPHSRFDDENEHFWYENHLSHPEIGQPALGKGDNKIIPSSRELIRQLTPSLLSLGITESDLDKHVISDWNHNYKPVDRRCVAALSTAQGRQGTEIAALRLSETAQKAAFRKGEIALYKERTVKVEMVLDIKPASYLIRLDDTTGTEVAVSGDDLTKRRTYQQIIAANAQAMRQTHICANDVPVWHHGYNRQQLVPDHETEAAPSEYTASAGYFGQSSLFSKSERASALDVLSEAASIAVSERSESYVYDEDDDYIWVCFDCEYKRNPPEAKFCIACDKPKNIGKRKHSTGGNLLLPSPNRIYIPRSECDIFQQLIINFHNELRASHKSPPLQYDNKLAMNAQFQANTCAKLVSLSHGNNEGQGQNTYMTGKLGGKAFKQIIVAACSAWQKEEATYRKSPGLHGLAGAGHYTQMVWKSTTSIGGGIAWAGSRVYVVVNYSPQGNVASDSEVLKNVRRRREPLSTD